MPVEIDRRVGRVACNPSLHGAQSGLVSVRTSTAKRVISRLGSRTVVRTVSVRERRVTFGTTVRRTKDRQPSRTDPPVPCSNPLPHLYRTPYCTLTITSHSSYRTPYITEYGTGRPFYLYDCRLRRPVRWGPDSTALRYWSKFPTVRRLMQAVEP